MADRGERGEQDHGEAPGAAGKSGVGYGVYLIGAGMAAALTVASFGLSSSSSVYAPAIPILLAALAIAQMGVHLVFFLHLSTARENLNTVMAVAFGVFVVGLVVFGSIIIMGNLNHMMMPMDEMIARQR